MNTLERLTRALRFGYGSPVTEKDVTGIGVLNDRGEEPQSANLPAFFASGASFMGGLDGEPQGSPERSRYANLSSSAHPDWRREAVLNRSGDRTMTAPINSVFSFQSTVVRTVTDERGDPLFCANDVCAVLGYKNPRMSVERHCKQGGVAKRDTPTESGNQEMTFINEGNLYRLIIKSRKPEAEAFERWVMEEVLPAIRKTGRYEAMPYTAKAGDSLTAEQADQLRHMLTDAANARFPGDGKAQGAFILRGWSKLKAHFKCGYRNIPQCEYAEAISLLSRHLLEIALPAPADPLAAAARDELTKPGRRFVATFYPDKKTGEPMPVMMAIPTGAVMLTDEELVSYVGNASGLSAALLPEVIGAAAKRLQAGRMLPRGKA